MRSVRPTTRFATALALCCTLASPSGAAAARKPRDAKEPGARTDVRAQARVVVERAPVYSGPGFGYRVIATVARDEVVALVERGRRGGWTRVRLESGIVGWILTEHVHVFLYTDDREPSRLRRFGRKLRKTILGPPNLSIHRFTGALSAGALGREGLFLVRPGVLVAPHVGVEAFVGPSSGREASRGIFGLSTQVFVTPHLPATIFVSVGAGAVYTKGKVDTLEEATWSGLLSPGGGFWIVFKYNIGIRFDVRNHILFRADTARSMQEYSGALAFSF